MLSPGEAFDLLPDAVILVDEAGRIAFANASVPRVLGYEQEELTDRPLTMLIPDRFRETHAENVAEYRAGGLPRGMSDRPMLLALHKSGREIPVSISIADLELSGTRFSVAVIRDAAPVRDELGEARVRAETDALTGLGNRRGLTRRMKAPLESGRSFGLLFLDLTRFKPFNDRYGHAAGDEVLRLVGKRLSAVVRPDDVAVRVGGDEFVLLLDGMSDDRDLQVRASQVAHRLGLPFHVRGIDNASIGVSIGGALYPRDGELVEEVMAIADRNMYRAKSAGTDVCTDAI